MLQNTHHTPLTPSRTSLILTMGISSLIKMPQSPLLNLSICVHDPPDRIYRPGDTVLGHIVLSHTVPISPQAIQVTLSGRSLVWALTCTHTENMTHYRHWRDNAPLFAITQNVLPLLNNVEIESTGTESFAANQTYTFPFEFVFATETSNS